MQWEPIIHWSINIIHEHIDESKERFHYYMYMCIQSGLDRLRKFPNISDLFKTVLNCHFGWAIQSVIENFYFQEFVRANNKNYNVFKSF